jgi:transcriptional regulator with XRE-family HTH domain
MTKNHETATFGTLLRVHRERSVERRLGRPLSQDRLARKLSEKTGLIFNRNNVGNWESDKAFPSVEDRRTLVSLIAILFEYSGISTFEEADRLLDAGNYRSLSDPEQEEIKHWLIKKGIPTPTAAAAASSFRSGRSMLDDVPEAGLKPENNSGGWGLKSLFHRPQAPVSLYDSECGGRPIDLSTQRLQISTSFGAYFVGLLEKPNLYLDLESQIDCPASSRQAGLAPLQRIFWHLEYARGPRILVIGGEGGMGKSTLSAKIIRCLHQEQAIDLILGDSAKSRHIDPLSKNLVHVTQGFYDPASFYDRLCSQVGLPAFSGKDAIAAIRDRLLGRRAVIVLDNLETVKKGDEILDALKTLTSRDIRAIVTTREIHGLKVLDSKSLVVQLQPITDAASVGEFLNWHIEQHQYQHPALRNLRHDLSNHILWLVTRTGGIPLIMQLVLSDVARSSWAAVRSLPSLFGRDLLDFLYQARWDELGRLGSAGHTAREVLRWIAREQYHGQLITSRTLTDWAVSRVLDSYLPAAISYLFEMFLVTNRDSIQGNFSIYPSLVEFIEKQAPDPAGK